MKNRRSRALAAVCAAVSLGACATAERLAWQMSMPGVAADFEVTSVEHRLGFLDVRLSLAGLERRIFARGDDPACVAMLVPGQTVRWKRSEPFGPLAKDDTRCTVVGLGDLEVWRNARGRASTTTRPLTSARTRLQVVDRDENFLYVLGGFSLAGRLGWRPGTDQVLALLPISPVCAVEDLNGLTTTEFRIAGTPALSVITRQGRCPVEAVIAAPRPESGGAGTEPTD